MRVRRLLVLLPAACAAAAGAATIYARPTYTTCHSAHRTFSQQDLDALRRVRWGAAPVPASHNPGVRVMPNFIGPAEADALVAELQGIKARHGIDLMRPEHAALYAWQMSYLAAPPPVNMLRVTGRPEHPAQLPPPWGYGDDFDEAKLPPRLRELAARVRSTPGLALGPLRDVTINYRRAGFFRLDPHTDPPADGENVFILGLNSDTVLTLSPVRWLQLARWWRLLRGALTMEDERDAFRREAVESWSSQDLDVLARARSLVLLSGDARWNWTHGTRLGVEAGPASGSSTGLHDWWGSADHLVPRNTERHSIVLAFAAAPEAAGRTDGL